MGKHGLHKARDLIGVLYTRQVFYPRAYIDDLRTHLVQCLFHVFRPEASGQNHPVSGQSAPRLGCQCQLQQDSRTASSMGDAWLHQHCIGIDFRLFDAIQVGRYGDTHDPPDLQCMGPEPRGIGTRVRAMELRPSQPTAVGYPEDFIS